MSSTSAIRYTSDYQRGLLWCATAVFLLALSPLAPALLELAPACPVKTVFGAPCPGCGSARAAAALAKFDLTTAVVLNPLATVFWVGLLTGGVMSGIAALLGRPFREPDWRFGMTTRLALVAVVTLNWVYLFWAGV